LLPIGGICGSCSSVVVVVELPPAKRGPNGFDGVWKEKVMQLQGMEERRTSERSKIECESEYPQPGGILNGIWNGAKSTGQINAFPFS
jgi:hypothetical protein